MTRSEFDQQVRELKNKKGNAIREIAALQSEIKEEIAAKHRQIDDRSPLTGAPEAPSTLCDTA